MICHIKKCVFTTSDEIYRMILTGANGTVHSQESDYLLSSES